MCTLACGLGVTGHREFAVPERGEKGSSRLGCETRCGQPFIQKLLEVVVAGKVGNLAAFFVGPYPAAALLYAIVFDLHRDGGADADESVAHERDQRAIAQADQGRDVDRGKLGSHFLGREHARLPFLTLWRGPRTACAGFDGMT
jgi:hypothetical protein